MLFAAVGPITDRIALARAAVSTAGAAGTTGAAPGAAAGTAAGAAPGAAAGTAAAAAAGAAGAAAGTAAAAAAAVLAAAIFSRARSMSAPLRSVCTPLKNDGGAARKIVLLLPAKSVNVTVGEKNSAL